MRTRPRDLFCVALSLSLASSVLALERSSARFDDDRADAWAASASVTTRYYNICNDWTWVWTGFEPSDRIGVIFTTPSWYGDYFRASWHRFGTVAPAGYGFTGTVALRVADPWGCPSGVPLQSQAFLPVSGWNLCVWRSPNPLRGFHVVHVTLGPAPGNPLSFYTDHPAAGPTGSQACGICYPYTRMTHSYYYGTAFCPGSAFYDGACNAELLWEFESMINAVDVESVSWGAIKNLYR